MLFCVITIITIAKSRPDIKQILKLKANFARQKNNQNTECSFDLNRLGNIDFFTHFSSFDILQKMSQKYVPLIGK